MTKPTETAIVTIAGFYDLESKADDKFVAPGAPMTVAADRAAELIALRLAEPAPGAPTKLTKS